MKDPLSRYKGNLRVSRKDGGKCEVSKMSEKSSSVYIKKNFRYYRKYGGNKELVEKRKQDTQIAMV